MENDLRRWMTLCETGEQRWQEAYVDRKPVVRVPGQDGSLVPPDFLYRIMSREEYENAKRTGFFRPRPGERIHASEHPMPSYGSGVNSVTVRLVYDDMDGWQAKWGDELYATTANAIPFSKASIVAERDYRLL